MTKFDLMTNFEPCEAQPGLSGNPFLWLEKPWQKDWERKTEIAAIILIFINNILVDGEKIKWNCENYHASDKKNFFVYVE